MGLSKQNGVILLGLSTAWLPGAADLIMTRIGMDGLAGFICIPLLAGALVVPLCIMGILWTRLRSYPKIIFLMTIGWFLYLECFKYSMGTRHFMMLLQIMLFILWIAKAHPPAVVAQGKDKLFMLINACLFYSVLLTGWRYYEEYHAPYSSSKPVAEFIMENKLEDKIIMIDLLYSLAAYLPPTVCIMPTPQMACGRRVRWEYPHLWNFYYKEISLFGGAGTAEGDGSVGAITLRRVLADAGTLDGRVYVLMQPLREEELRQYHLVPLRNIKAYTESSWIYMTEKDVKTDLQGFLPQ